MARSNRQIAAFTSDHAVASKQQRYAYSQQCAQHLDLCLRFHIDALNGPCGKDNAAGEFTWDQKNQSSEWITNRALGRVPQPVEQVIEDNQQIKHIYEIRWLPPDPNDRSNYIAPIGGE